MNFKKLLLISLLPASMAVNAGFSMPAGNLLENGGFEDVAIDTGTWAYFSNGHNGNVDLSWDYGQSSIEIWGTPFLRVTAFEGSNIAELNAHGANNAAYGFVQNFDTEVGQTYNYGFAYRARKHNSESFLAGIVGIDADTLFDDHTKGGWSYYSASFVAADTTSTIAFLSNDALGDTTGNLLDGVYVTKAVPEPGSLALMGLGVLGLAFSRKKF